MDEEKPEYTRFWFVKAKGKETAWTQTQKQGLHGSANLESLEQLHQGCKFMECMGLPDEKKVLATIENVKYSLLMKEVEQCRST